MVDQITDFLTMITAVIGLPTAIILLVQSRSKQLSQAAHIAEIHVLVNSRLERVLAENDVLKHLLYDRRKLPEPPKDVRP